MAVAVGNGLCLISAFQALSRCSNLHSEPELQESLGNAIFSQILLSLPAPEDMKELLSIFGIYMYSNSPTYEQVLFPDRVRKSNLFVSPTKLA